MLVGGLGGGARRWAGAERGRRSEHERQGAVAPCRGRRTRAAWQGSGDAASRLGRGAGRGRRRASARHGRQRAHSMHGRRRASVVGEEASNSGQDAVFIGRQFSVVSLSAAKNKNSISNHSRHGATTDFLYGEFTFGITNSNRGKIDSLFFYHC